MTWIWTKVQTVASLYHWAITLSLYLGFPLNWSSEVIPLNIFIKLPGCVFLFPYISGNRVLARVSTMDRTQLKWIVRSSGLANYQVMHTNALIWPMRVNMATHWIIPDSHRIIVIKRAVFCIIVFWWTSENERLLGALGRRVWPLFDQDAWRVPLIVLTEVCTGGWSNVEVLCHICRYGECRSIAEGSYESKSSLCDAYYDNHAGLECWHWQVCRCITSCDMCWVSSLYDMVTKPMASCQDLLYRESFSMGKLLSFSIGVLIWEPACSWTKASDPKPNAQSTKPLRHPHVTQ